LNNLYDSTLTGDEKNYLNIFNNWNFNNDADAKGATVFTVWWDSLTTELYGDEFSQTNLPLAWPESWAVLEDMQKDSAKLFADNINTSQKENLAADVTIAFKKAVSLLQQVDQKNMLAWGKFKGSAIRHLLRVPALSRMNIIAGGGDDIINAFEKYHGPSWRMVVELTDKINAYAIYPGGQEGNPGSKYYDQFINDYLAGKYYKLLFAPESEVQQQNNLKGKLTFSKQ
jgi:penicillin amidase